MQEKAAIGFHRQLELILREMIGFMTSDMYFQGTDGNTCLAYGPGAAWHFFHSEQRCPEHLRWQPPGTQQLANGLTVLVWQHIAVVTLAQTPCPGTPPESRVTVRGAVPV